MALDRQAVQKRRELHKRAVRHAAGTLSRQQEDAIDRLHERVATKVDRRSKR